MKIPRSIPTVSSPFGILKSPLSSPFVKRMGNLFNPLLWFAKGEQGAWYDPSDFLPNWRRNLLLRSNDFLAWSFSNTTLTTGVDDAFGGALATTVSATANNGLIFTSFASVGYSAQTIYIRRKTGGGLIYIRNATNNLVDVTTSVTSTWSRLNVPSVSISGTAYFGVNISVSGDAVDICFGQCETGSTPSTYQKITDGIQDYYTYQPQPVLFQDSAGTLPAALEYPVGLMLDKSKGLALGAELVTNGDFSNGSTGWSLGAGWSVAGGVASFSNATGTSLSQANTFSAGMTYQIEFDLISGALSSISLFGGGADVSSGISGAGRKKLNITTTANRTGVSFNSVGGSTATISNISVKQIAGNHAFQATSANRPILSSRVNLLTKTEDFSDAAWAKLASGTASIPVVTNNAGIAPDGTNTASQVVFNTGVGTTIADKSYLSQSIANLATVGATYSLGVWIKGSVGSQIQVRQQGAAGYSLITLTGGWDFYPSQVVSIITASLFDIGLRQGLTGTINSNITVLLWHPDLRPTNAGALLPPYQRVNTASDYDSVGFPLYLKCNGTSSAMSTNSIDFTSTDKMTVVTGVRKLVDATSMLMELSSTSATDSFYLTAPFTSSNYGFGTGGGAVVNSSYTTPSTNIISNSVDRVIDGLQLTYNNMRVNGSTPTTRATAGNTTIAGSQNFGNYPFYLFARAGTSLHFNGHFYGAIIRGAQSDTASVIQTENYMAQKTGITF